ncbi:MAG TPA: glutathione S-transferase family protein [Trichocoleus sp.]
MLKLVIGNKNYSSWSLRAWLFLQESGLNFEEVKLPLSTRQWQQNIGRYTPAGKVPVLLDGSLSIWDTLAIFEYVLECYSTAIGWPTDGVARAIARSVSAEMHAGFLAVRAELPQNLRARKHWMRSQLSQDCQQQIQRIEQIWADYKSRYGHTGDWLFGSLSIADIMYAPVALRFVTYSIQIDPNAQWFVDAVQALPSVQQWVAAAAAEPEALSEIDQL